MEVRCDQGSYSGLLSVSDCDLLQPLRMTYPDFEAARRRLTGGFNELVSKPIHLNDTVFSAKAAGRDSSFVHSEVVNLLQKELNLFLVQNESEVLFAGSRRKGSGEEKALVSVKYDSDRSVHLIRHSFSKSLMCIIVEI